jgi:2-aminophenol/2-amino-5-chlorophenol 1,6-dioxygenase alpha subunit
LIESGDVGQLRRLIPEFAKEARVDMGFKHFHWILGALNGRFSGARVHGYGPAYGTGAAVVEFVL